MKSGFVVILGRPNVGKSTLLNAIMKYEISITSHTPQTTRDQIKGIYNDLESQIIFIDTPGIHKPKQKLGEFLNIKSYKALEDIDVVIFLQPINEKIGPGDKLILEMINGFKNKIAIMTKVDLETNPLVLQKKSKELKLYGFNTVLGTSYKYDKSITQVINEIKSLLPEGIKFYKEDMITDKSIRFIAKEIIRESAVRFMKKELPHSIGVEIIEFQEKKDKNIICARIYCDRDSQKGIIIGKNGSMIKKIRIISKKKLSYLFNQTTQLELKVKVNKNWTKDEKKIIKLGY